MPLLDRDDSVLVVVDAQPGSLAGEADSAVERMAWLVALASRLGIPVVEDAYAVLRDPALPAPPFKL